MIAEDYFSGGETDALVGGTTAGRQNRNLSCIVSTIRDDGPSTTEDDRAPQDAGSDNDCQVDAPEGPAVEIMEPVVQPQKVRALPGLAVMSKVTAVLVLLAFLGGTVLLASGKYPVLDDQGLHLADLPTGVVTEMAIVKDGVEEAFTHWLAQARLLFSSSPAPAPATRAPAVTGRVDVEAQQQIFQRMDMLAAAVETLKSRFDRDQDERLMNSRTRQAELDSQLQAVQAQLTGLQQQLAEGRGVVPAPPPVAQTGNTSEPLSTQGDWVVNVASSSQEKPITQLQRKLGKQGIATEIHHTDRNGELRYRLRVSGFSTGGEAKRYAEKLVHEQGLKGAWASKR